MNRKATIPLLILVAAAWMLAVPHHARAQEKNLNLDQAVKMAREQGPGISAAKVSIEAAQYTKKKAFAGFFPILNFELRVLYYSEKPGISTDIPSLEIPPDLPIPEDEFDGWLLTNFLMPMGEMFSSFTSFESKQYDVNITLSLTQPITPLYQVYYGYKLADLGIDVARIEVEKTGLELVYNVKEAYFSILKLQHGLEAMDQGIGLVTAHVQKAELFFQQKIITKNDVLQAKARLAQLEADRIAMEGTLQVVYEGFNAATGLDAGTTPVLAEPSREFSGNIPSFKDAMKAAKANRPDLAQMRLRIQQAGLAKKIAVGDYIPQLAAMVSYTHNEGSLMTYPPVAFGGVLSWNFWSWGAKWYGVKEADAMMRAAEEALKAMETAVAVDVKQALTSLQTAIQTLEKAEASVVASEEQLRIEQERYAQNVTTSTEVLDAQTRLTQAQLQRENARYDIHIALAKLEKATGREWN